MNLILKARQMGITTFICILFLDAAVFNSNTHCGIIAHNKDDAEDFFFNKVKFAYDRLPPQVQGMVQAVNDSARQLRFSNGSSIKVGTSMRSGTLQYLHVSEFGKICAKYPDKAKEIVTGALNTVQAGQFIFIESTAEGQHGYFYDYCEKAKNLLLQGKDLTPLDFRFFFFPWWKHPDYMIDPEGVVISQTDELYFLELEAKIGTKLTAGQKAWYVKKKETQDEDMLREYPSTPEEAFAAKIKGAYYAKQMAKIRIERRICKVPYEPAIPVNVGWDLGMNDTTVLWFHQRIGVENRIIDYYEENGESLAHYVKVMQDRGYVYGQHFLPHDVEVHELTQAEKKTRKEVLEDLGVRNIVVVDKAVGLADGIEAVRNFLPTCYFDEAKTKDGRAGLDAYQKEWDEKIGGYRDHPLHNWASNPADGFRMLAVGFSPRRIMKGKKSRRRRDARVV